MIASPRRSVTRFFIPLIDVLILLFCIFLLMPFVSAPAKPEPEPETKAAPPPPELPADVKDLQDQLAEARRRLAQLEKERNDRLGRQVVRVLEIDFDTGKLYYYAPDRTEIRTEAEALKYIALQKTLAGNKDLFFSLLLPRPKPDGRLSGFPLPEQRRDYDRWFKDVPHGYDKPGDDAGGSR